jgi:ElaB/YqjD/DUF883 family membrane-anchored ribosome-binding protein
MSQAKLHTATTFEDRAAQTVGEAANAAGAAVRDAGAHIRDAAADFGARVRKTADGTANDLAKRVEQQPLSSIVVAAGVGLVAGMLLARR